MFLVLLAFVMPISTVTAITAAILGSSILLATIVATIISVIVRG